MKYLAISLLILSALAMGTVRRNMQAPAPRTSSLPYGYPAPTTTTSPGTRTTSAPQTTQTYTPASTQTRTSVPAPTQTRTTAPT